MTETNNKLHEIASNYFKAWTNKEFDKAAEYLSEHISFEMPINSYDNKHAFMEAVKFTRQHASQITLLANFENENESILLYDLVLNPIGNLRIAEHFKLSDNKITMIRHIHDTAELRKAGFDKQN